jgi:hypothetical protein
MVANCFRLPLCDNVAQSVVRILEVWSRCFLFAPFMVVSKAYLSAWIITDVPFVWENIQYAPLFMTRPLGPVPCELISRLYAMESIGNVVATFSRVVRVSTSQSG